MAIRVAVDALGGDRGPGEVVSGALAAATPEIVPVLYGPADLDTRGLEHVVTDGMVEMDDKPAEAVRAKPESSLVRAVRAVGEGAADVVVSAGNTGAMLAAGLLHVRRLAGVHRPGIGVVIPSVKGPLVLIDGGANADARPEHLVQFAHMGALFSHDVLGVQSPTVGLLSIGEEPEKGNQLTLEAHAALTGTELRFVGNVEGRSLLEGGVDVLVCDGFTGNVALKTLEGTIKTLLGSLRDEISASVTGKLGGLLIRPAARRLRERLDPDTYGGAYLLGLRGLLVIAHGSSSSRAIANAIRLGAAGVEHDIVSTLAERLPSASPART
ncbi:MAG: phosphate acyltransferase PlsX [Gaiellales bacterium]